MPTLVGVFVPTKVGTYRRRMHGWQLTKRVHGFGIRHPAGPAVPGVRAGRAVPGIYRLRRVLPGRVRLAGECLGRSDLGRRFRANQGWHLPKRGHGFGIRHPAGPALPGVCAGRAVPGVYRLRRVLPGWVRLAGECLGRCRPWSAFSCQPRLAPTEAGARLAPTEAGAWLAPTEAGAWLAPIEAHTWFRDDAGGHSRYRSISKTIRHNMRAIAVIGIALLLNPILDLGEHTAWR